MQLLQEDAISMQSATSKLKFTTETLIVCQIWLGMFSAVHSYTVFKYVKVGRVCLRNIHMQWKLQYKH